MTDDLEPVRMFVLTFGTRVLQDRNIELTLPYFVIHPSQVLRFLGCNLRFLWLNYPKFFDFVWRRSLIFDSTSTSRRSLSQNCQKNIDKKIRFA